MSVEARFFEVEALLGSDRWLRRLAGGLLRDGPGVDDVLQDTRLAMLESPPPRLADPRSWLARVALNFARKRRRQDVRRARRERRAARPERLQSCPREAMERVELRRLVCEAVLALDEPYRSTVVLRFFEEMSLAGIAERSGVPLGTVKTRLQRALERLRRRLGALQGGGRGWAVLLIPFLEGGPRAPAGLGGAAAKGLGWIGVMGMSTKGMMTAIAISIALIVGALTVVLRHEDHAAPGAKVASRLPLDSKTTSAGSTAAAAGSSVARAAEGIAQAEPASARGAAGPAPGAEAALPAPEVLPADPPPPASAEALAAREAFRLLKATYGEGGGAGWRAVALGIARLEEALLGSPEGLREFLALVDAETDASFLEALMHHLPQARTDHRDGIVASEELQREVWARYQEAEDPGRRTAFLRFFAFNRQLSSARMDDFLEIAQGEPDRGVRQIAVDAIASNPTLISETWQVLARAVESDPDPECRETALQGLAYSESEGARALVKAAFVSPDERMRAAALGSAAGDRIPEDLTGGDAAAYLIGELRSARTPLYKRAILKRMVGGPQEAFAEELRRLVGEEKDLGVRKSYREAIEAIEESRAARR
jgi:RNA polymerase sigma factor (sigma-70 family)